MNLETATYEELKKRRQEIMNNNLNNEAILEFEKICEKMDSLEQKIVKTGYLKHNLYIPGCFRFDEEQIHTKQSLEKIVNEFRESYDVLPKGTKFNLHADGIWIDNDYTLDDHLLDDKWAKENLEEFRRD